MGKRHPGIDWFLLFLLMVFALPALGFRLENIDEQKKEEEKKEEGLSSSRLKGLRFREIGPALTSGRIIDIAVNPRYRSHYFVAAASGGVWKTENWGTTWKPVFDSANSYSIGCLALDPNDPLVIWAGTGENNSQRSVSYGDGVYKSVDGGKSWKNVGLPDSQHIGMIAIDPRDSNRVFVASQGPLWSPGGDRGLYATEDGGQNWQKVLEISEHTGVSEIHLDPRNPDTMYAISYQRRRHVWTLINGGPESAVYKSVDAGKTWRKINKGLPGGDLGRIGMEISPINPDVLYAIVEAAGGKSGFYRSPDKGESWSKQSSYVSGSPQYYQEIVADPNVFDRVYSLDTYLMVTEDGGKSFGRVKEKFKHVDSHAIWIDPENSDHLLVGCDGGLYETFDRGEAWDYKANLPITQFYRIATDNALPFYNVYGGTQDNYSLGGPSRTTNLHGIVNADWFVTKGGDGFQSRVDPEDPNIVYTQSQHGSLARFDKQSGERLAITPTEDAGEALKWNWNSPLIISPHSHTRLYFAANRLFRSDNRGDSWEAVSGDLTARVDRDKLEVMGRVWSVDAVSKNASTSTYGTIVSLAESPLKEDLVYVGTDDGLIQVSDNVRAGSWRRAASIPGVPESTYISDIEPSHHGADTVYAAFDNHKRGDFKPYILKSTDRGQGWTSIAGNLPERGSIHTIAEDPVKPGLIFVGTEFGVWMTVDDGAQWVQLAGGLPPIAIRDLEIQTRESDLVAGSFGRGIFILDDYSPLREIDKAALDSEALLFKPKEAWIFIQDSPLGDEGKAYQGDSLFTAENPPFGAVFTYYLKDGLKTLKEQRQEVEKQLVKDGKPVPYPSWDALRAEDQEEKPTLVLTIADAEGSVVRRLEGSTGAGFHRLTWDLRYPAVTPASTNDSDRSGPLVVPGNYRVSLAKRVLGTLIPLAEERTFTVSSLSNATLPAEDKQSSLEFQKKVGRLQRAVLGAGRALRDADQRVALIKQAISDTPDADESLMQEALRIQASLQEISIQLNGDRVKSTRFAETPPSISSRVRSAVNSQIRSTSAPTATQRKDYEIAGNEFAPLLERFRNLVENDLPGLEQKLEALGAPWTPGRVPTWTMEK